MQTRRRFLFDCSALAVVASVSPNQLLGASVKLPEVPLHKIAFHDFAGSVRTVFRVSTVSGHSVRLRLVEAASSASSNLKSDGAEDGLNEKFSLHFTGPGDVPLPQNSCVFEHPRLGRFTMFISPVGPNRPDVCFYEACFNRPAAGRLAACAGA